MLLKRHRGLCRGQGASLRINFSTIFWGQGGTGWGAGTVGSGVGGWGAVVRGVWCGLHIQKNLYMREVAPRVEALSPVMGE